MDAAPSQDLDDLIRRVDPDRWISSRFIGGVDARGDVVALYAFDHELARAPRAASNALIGEMRLVWWREVIDEIFEGRPVRRHPTAEALAATVRRRRLPREALERLVDARYRELDPAPLNEKDALEWARDTAGLVAELAAQVLAPEADAGPARAAGAAWALGRRSAATPALRPVFERARSGAKTAVRRLSPLAFPAVAHAALAGKSGSSELAKRLVVTLAVARGRI